MIGRVCYRWQSKQHMPLSSCRSIRKALASALRFNLSVGSTQRTNFPKKRLPLGLNRFQRRHYPDPTVSGVRLVHVDPPGKHGRFASHDLDSSLLGTRFHVWSKAVGQDPSASRGERGMRSFRFLFERGSIRVRKGVRKGGGDGWRVRRHTCSCVGDTSCDERRAHVAMATVKDVPADAFIAAYAEHLKASDKVRGVARRDGKSRRWKRRRREKRAAVVGTTKEPHLRDVDGATALEMGGKDGLDPHRERMDGVAAHRWPTTSMRSRP